MLDQPPRRRRYPLETICVGLFWLVAFLVGLFFAAIFLVGLWVVLGWLAP